jgi:hypothetical protein
MNTAWNVVSQIAGIEPDATPHDVDQVEHVPGLYTVSVQYAEHRGAVRAFCALFDTAAETLTPRADDEDLVARATVDGVQVTVWTRVHAAASQQPPASAPEVEDGIRLQVATAGDAR